MWFIFIFLHVNNTLFYKWQWKKIPLCYWFLLMSYSFATELWAGQAPRGEQYDILQRTNTDTCVLQVLPGFVGKQPRCGAVWLQIDYSDFDLIGLVAMVMCRASITWVGYVCADHMYSRRRTEGETDCRDCCWPCLFDHFVKVEA